jgi:L,D-transpeptidase catalytic domain
VSRPAAFTAETRRPFEQLGPPSHFAVQAKHHRQRLLADRPLPCADLILCRTQSERDAARRMRGATSTTAKYTDPSWIPPQDMRDDRPRPPPFIPGGSPENPMGVAAMTLSGGELSIHGTNEPNSVRHLVPYGCIRMFSEDIADLYRRVGIGTPVIVE